MRKLFYLFIAFGYINSFALSYASGVYGFIYDPASNAIVAAPAAVSIHGEKLTDISSAVTHTKSTPNTAKEIKLVFKVCLEDEQNNAKHTGTLFKVQQDVAPVALFRMSQQIYTTTQNETCRGAYSLLNYNLPQDEVGNKLLMVLDFKERKPFTDPTIKNVGRDFYATEFFRTIKDKLKYLHSIGEPIPEDFQTDIKQTSTTTKITFSFAHPEDHYFFTVQLQNAFIIMNEHLKLFGLQSLIEKVNVYADIQTVRIDTKTKTHYLGDLSSGRDLWPTFANEKGEIISPQIIAGNQSPTLSIRNLALVQLTSYIYPMGKITGKTPLLNLRSGVSELDYTSVHRIEFVFNFGEATPTH